MNTIGNLDTATPMGKGDPTKASASPPRHMPGSTERRYPTPRVKSTPQGFFIDHADAELGEQLMANALGVTDRDAMHGILRQLVSASVNGPKPDEVNLGFMIEMVRGIQPRDPIEAMLAAQMVSVHVMAMRCAHRLACAQDIAQQEASGRALSRLARTFPAQIEALNRHRSSGEPAIRVQNVSVQDGGKAIVGNVTQHAAVVVRDRGAPEPDPASSGQSAEA